jgi:hypothetical protein
MYKEFRLDLTHAQAVKVLHGKPIRLTAEQLGKGHAHYLHPENHKKLVRAYQNHKGTTLHMAHGEVLRTHQSGLSGAGFWGDLWKGVKKGAKFIKDSGILSKLLDAGVPAAATYLGQPGAAGPVRGAIRSMTGVGLDQEPIEGGKLTMKDVKSSVKKAYGYAKQKGIVTDAIDQGEKFLLSKSDKPEHHQMIRSVRRGIRKKWGVGMHTDGGSFRLN